MSNGSMSQWKLSAVLIGHSADVRAVSAGPEGCLLSASRDVTAKLWHPQGTRDFSDVVTYKGHNNFVSSICFLAPSLSYPQGLIITGSNDKTICAYNIQEPLPILRFSGHENTVCSVVPSMKPGIFLSASWDSTARVWSLDSSEKELFILKGHQAVVWAVIELGNGYIATASADKNIFLWNEQRNKLKTLSGHTDCVRGLSIASQETFLSCANDASIRLWTNGGDCLSTIFGHSNYIYSICINSYVPEQFYVSCGEDSTVRIWKTDKNVETITLPAQSVWSVACLLNGDIACGSSDGIVRVFTRDQSRIADPPTLTAFEEDVQKHLQSQNQEIGGIKVTDLPGPEVLHQPGKADGQTKLIRCGDKVRCYSWSHASQSWSEIGEVTGSAKPTEGKTMHMGKEYDFVFSVDIEDGKPAIKLPYNLIEDPWVAAQEFIHKNNLPQAYLEQVANFIITNSKRDGIPVVNKGFHDPFTGGTRYVPGSNSTSNQTAGVNADPFTGSSSYSTSNNSTAESTARSKYFPHKSYLRFDQANIAVIKDKLVEFNGKVDGNLSLSKDEIEGVIRLADQGCAYNEIAVSKLKLIVEWPKDILFPVLDILRLAIRNEKINTDIFDKNNYGPQLYENLMKNLSPDSNSANRLLTLRILSNAFIHFEGEMFVLREHENILTSLIGLHDLNKNSQIALATLLLNMCVALGGQPNATFLSQCLLDASFGIEDNEAKFRILVALGTLLQEAPVKSEIKAVIVASDNFMNKLRLYANTNEQKISTCSKDILSML